jgi:uncharacterized RDD family membrane protein YckC
MSMPPPPPPPPPSFPTGPSAGGAAGSTSASFGSRFLAFFIDGLVQGVFTLPGYILLAAGADALGSLLVFAGLPAFFVVYCKKVAAGQSWGQKIANVRVIDINTRANLTPGRVFLRQLCKIISGFVCYLGFFWMLWDKNQQTWHDKIVDTAVVNA